MNEPIYKLLVQLPLVDLALLQRVVGEGGVAWHTTENHQPIHVPNVGAVAVVVRVEPSLGLNFEPLLRC